MKLRSIKVANECCSFSVKLVWALLGRSIALIKPTSYFAWFASNKAYSKFLFICCEANTNRLPNREKCRKYKKYFNKHSRWFTKSHRVNKYLAIFRDGLSFLQKLLSIFQMSFMNCIFSKFYEVIKTVCIWRTKPIRLDVVSKIYLKPLRYLNEDLFQ